MTVLCTEIRFFEKLPTITTDKNEKLLLKLKIKKKNTKKNPERKIKLVRVTG